MSAVGSNDVDAARPGGENISFSVNLHAIGYTFFCFRPRRSVEEDFAIGDATIRLHVIDHPDRVGWVGVADVKFFFVRREGDAVGRFDILREQSELAVF